MKHVFMFFLFIFFDNQSKKKFYMQDAIEEEGSDYADDEYGADYGNHVS